MGARQILLRLILGQDRAKQVYSGWRTRRIEKLPDRQLMVNTYLPAFAADGGKILWVGCREYTAGYIEVLEARGGRVWSTDIDPECAGWGHPDRHRIGDICAADTLFGDVTFDSILFNGVLGFGVNDPQDQKRAFNALASILRPGGRMLVGWNDNKIHDPIASGLADPWFTPAPYAGRAARVTFPGLTHVYDCLTRNS